MPRFQVSEDVTLFYTDQPPRDPGAGDSTVLLVHGWGCDSNDWIYQIPALSRRHRVIAVDNRGHGWSTGSRDFEPAMFAHDLALLLTSLGSAPVVAIGHSLGGFIVSRLGVERPDLVRALVVIDPGYGVSDAERGQLTALESVLESRDAGSILAEAFADLSGSTAPAHQREWHRRRALGLDSDTLVSTLRGIVDDPLQNRPDATTYFARRAMPTLGLYKSDRSENARWEESLSNNELDEFHVVDAGHWLHQERSDEVNSMLVHWIERLP